MICNTPFASLHGPVSTVSVFLSVLDRLLLIFGEASVSDAWLGLGLGLGFLTLTGSTLIVIGQAEIPAALDNNEGLRKMVSCGGGGGGF